MDHTTSTSRFEQVIRPAILKLVAETQGSYRCERDLHHHFTVCLNSITSLSLGNSSKLAHMEEPAKACYGSGRNGNLDYFFPQHDSGPSGTALELNFNYDSPVKIMRDIQKLIDPENAFSESVYFAFGQKVTFFESIKRGVQRAFDYFAESNPQFLLPTGLHIVVVELKNRRDEIAAACASVDEPCIPNEMNWTELPVNRHAKQSLGASTISNADRKKKAGADPAECKRWLYWVNPGGKEHFIAFVNAKGSCSLRQFDAKSGILLSKPPNQRGDFQDAFQSYLEAGTQVFLEYQPNLETQCKPKLPAKILLELQRQVRSVRTNN